MGYMEKFEAHYREWFATMHIESIVTYEENLSRFIDSDLFDGFVLEDEVLLMYEIIRDECVKRCQIMADRPR